MSDAKQFAIARGAEFTKLYSENKLAEMIELYAPDAKLMSPGRPIVVGRSAIKDFFQSEYNAAYRYTVLPEEVLELGGETILDRGQYTFCIGDQLVDEGKYVTVYKKIDGKWLTYIGIMNSDRPSK